MYARNGGAWGSKKSSGVEQRHSLGNWPQLGERSGNPKANEVETWPRLGGSDSRKNEESGNYTATSCRKIENDQQNVSIRSKGVPVPSASAERQKSPWNAKVADNKGSSSAVKPLTSDSKDLGVGTPQGNGEHVALSNKEEKNLAFKKMCKERKAELKAEKRRKKENDTLRKMLAPKGLKVTVIDEKIFSQVHDKALNRSRPPENNTSVREVQLDTSAFPDLRSVGNPCVRSTVERSQKSLNSAKIPESESKAVDAIPKVLDEDQPKPTKSKKRRDPVVVDIWKAIEICQAAKKLEGEGEGGVTTISKRKENTKLSGNMLDSSNPLRHRGKKRETPKKRHMTRLKRAILAERKRRREARSGFDKIESTPAAGDTNCPDSVVEISTVDPHLDVSSTPVGEPLNLQKEEDAQGLKEVEIKEKSEECLTKQNPSEADIDKMVKDSLHSRNFREYCNHCKNSDLTEHVKAMLKDIIKFQDRMHATQPIKSASHRRYVVGLRQTQNSLAAHKVKIVILAQDMERDGSPGSLDDAVKLIIDSAAKQNVPVVFPALRRQLGKITLRKVGVSCVGVLNYQGSEENFKKTISALELSKKEYEEKFFREKTRIINELGMLPAKGEDEEVKEGVLPGESECCDTLPLLRKLTEAIAELSVSSPSHQVEG
ncbi:selenocysteine insertion sequence-binding protein 2 [Ischnura elegans]|uniref:selenocysteine insertion sequence-binding protein 2 n=1 Tax=Ischnura elegans TaxID=197161 RepID=UPI001ED88010|nr:selenocysteine insertion sequence-binding protein 2 [Ischnura elegans]